jgi:hypothetical protein
MLSILEKANQEVEKSMKNHRPSEQAPKSKNIKKSFRSFPKTPIAQIKAKSTPAGVARKGREKQCKQAKRTWYRESKKVEREEVSESKSRSRRPLRGTSRPDLLLPLFLSLLVPGLRQISLWHESAD